MLEGVRVAVEQAARTVDHAQMAKLSWRRVQLSGANLAGCDLGALDFRDAILTGAVLDGANLSGTNFTAAKLQGASLNGADLSGANLTYADLAGASLKGTRLAGAAMDNAGILNLELQGADLRGVASGWRGAPWDVTRDWRRATFDPEARAALDKVYGAEVPPVKILMLLWETPPFVAGGSWTAAYHLVRKLRRRGADLTVVTPWRRDLLEDYPFGLDVPLVGLGVTPPRNAGPGGYDNYGGYGSRGASPYGPYAPYNPYGMGDLLGSVLYVLMGEYRARLSAFLAEKSFDVVHGHDWVTFDAARSAADVLGVPWVAHFHSLESDRNPSTPDILTMGIERSAAHDAFAIAAPSEVTRRRIASAYGASPDRIVVAPNVLTEEPIAPDDVGNFESRRVVFVGRLVEQKGIDRFDSLARAVLGTSTAIRFEAVGGGAGAEALQFARRRGPLPWSRRGEAFREATVVVMPSRSEPFGMVALEAMQHRAPVIYPRDSGAAEVLESGVKVDPADIEAMAQIVTRLANDQTFWETTVRGQAAEIAAYPHRDYEDALVALWSRAAESKVAAKLS